MAVSLGRSSGAALLGRTLDISVQTVLNTSDNPDICLEADVFYADERVEKSRIQTTVEKTGPGTAALIRIRAAKLVDEPVVTLYVRAGCVQRTERRYVLLADLVSEPLPSTGAVPLAVPSAGVQAAAKSEAAREPVRSVPRQSGTGEVLARPSVARETPAARSRPEPKSRPRLKLEPLDLRVDTSPQLKATHELLSLPTDNEEQRLLAAAMWKVLTAQPQDVLRDAGKISAMDADLRSLQAETRKNQAALAEFRAELQKAQGERYANSLVYSLMTALVLLIAAGAYFWRRRPLAKTVEAAAPPWWHRKKMQDSHWLGSEAGALSADYGVHTGSDILPSPPPGEQAKAATPDPASRGYARAGAPASRFTMPPLSRRDQLDFALSMPHRPRAAKAEELFDVQHQAEFFVTLGQHEQAIAVLREHLGDDVHSSALIHLDLLHLYHKLKREEDYQALRVEFEQLFNANIPPFESYSAVGAGLASYPDAMSQIEAVWPDSSVLTVMESLLFREPGGQGATAFDIEAYRELLLLYGIAREIVEVDAPVAGSLLDFDLPLASPSVNPATGVEGQSLAKATTFPVSASPVEPAPPKGVRRLGLDIDLNTLADRRTPPSAVLPPEFVPVQPGNSDGHLIDFEAISVQPPAFSAKPDAKA
ncbi:hypothetical protein [Polaromonas sp. SM01]|uniref:type IV pilus assembly protein FimV n=1 Tax=Polaromonas sp. SM01 TaxID=3085630 RepID=UPI002980D74A|nr:hypothetical protein [Polaromonas sp. SM01]MDW5441631.1 hypothetical protein [Polaromonas sp. SM01]